MLLFPRQIDSSFMPIFTLVLKLIFLASFGRNKYALAQYLGPDDRYPISPWEIWHQIFGAYVPETSDYPSDEDIQRNFFGTGLDQTLVMVISIRYLPQYREYCTAPELRLKCVYLAFPNRYLTRIGRNGKERSRRWARDFYVRYNAVYIAGASGAAHVLTNNASPPRSCTYFDEIIRQLKLNMKVVGIILVSAQDWNVQRVFWIRPDEYGGTKGSDANRDDGSGGGAGETRNNAPSSAASLLIPLTLGEPVSSAAGAADALKSTVSPLLQTVPGDRQDKNSGVEPLKFPLETDILPTTVGSLPYSDDKAVGTDGQLLMSLAEGTSASEPPTDEKSTTSKISSTESATAGMPAIDKSSDLGSETEDIFKTTADQIADYESLNLRDLFQRRHRLALALRDSGDDSDECLGWLTESGFPGNPNQPATSSGMTSDPTIAPSAQTDGNFEKLFIFAKEDVATLLVTQHDKATADGHYTFDISIRNSQNKVIHYEQGVDAPSGKKIKVSVPWESALPNLLKAPFSWPLYLSTGENKEDPLRIEYGDYFLLGPRNWGGAFDSSDPGHNCVVGAWMDSKRHIQCSIVVAHPSLPEGF